jgi:hypothetical protein
VILELPDHPAGFRLRDQPALECRINSRLRPLHLLRGCNGWIGSSADPIQLSLNPSP